jgi:glycosyltransferase involved in cell wall biosynthesis
MRTDWSALAESLNVSNRVEFVGWLPQQESARHQEAIALLPNIFECGGAIVLEAMAVGIPVIATASEAPQATWIGVAGYWSIQPVVFNYGN